MRAAAAPAYMTEASAMSGLETCRERSSANTPTTDMPYMVAASR